MAEKNTKWHQVLAVLGVMLSLGFVGYEIRQNTRVARAAAVQGISEAVIEWTTTMLENDDWMRIQTFVDNGGKREDLSPLDQQRYYYGAVSTLRLMDLRFRQVQLGIIDESEIDVGGGRANLGWYRSEHFLDFWQSIDQTTRWPQDFIDFMETEVLGLR